MLYFLSTANSALYRTTTHDLAVCLTGGSSSPFTQHYLWFLYPSLIKRVIWDLWQTCDMSMFPPLVSPHLSPAYPCDNLDGGFFPFVYSKHASSYSVTLWSQISLCFCCVYWLAFLFRHDYWTVRVRRESG